MVRNRKGQGISMNVIIIAAIALLVLVILTVLLVRKSNDVSTATSCEGTAGGNCVPGPNCGTGEQRLFAPCPGEQVCCKNTDDFLSVPSGST